MSLGVSASSRPLSAALVAALSLGLAAPSVASASASGVSPALSHGGLELADGEVRSLHRAPAWDRPALAVGASWPALRQRLGVSGSLWDPATGVPLRVWGAGLAAPGSIDAPEKARRSAAALLRDHLDVLAPGADLKDFEVVSDALSRGVRSVGFAQRYRGRPVVGGQISFRYKHDRLVMIASEALAVADVELTDAPIADDRAQAAAVDWLVAGGYTGVEAAAVSGPMILPIVDRREQRFVEVLRVEVAAERPFAKAWVYVDASSGAPVAAQTRLFSGVVDLEADVPIRYPLADRHALPLRGMNVTVDGQPAVTDENGQLTTPDIPTEIVATLEGPLLKVKNSAGDDASEVFTLGPGEVGTWSGPDDPHLDSQLTNFTAVYEVKQRVMSIAPELEWLQGQISVTANLTNGECNAFSDGDSIFFLQGKEGVCEYTSRIPDVSYHEVGHSVHSQGLIPGVGAFDGALSEGISDYLAATITGDAKMGMGFFLDDKPMRNLDPPNYEWHWPEDRGEIHAEGRIIGGALWDLRKALVDKLGEADGVAKTDEIWYESIRRATNIPTMYPEALLVDDDDGDLSNGTPNQCEIDTAFYIHGLVLADAFGAKVEVLAEEGDGGVPIKLDVDVAAKEECLGITVDGATLDWRVRGSDEVTSVAMGSVEGGFAGVIPPQSDGVVVEYQVRAEVSDGMTITFPDNPADPWYERYFGPVTPIYCTGFENADEIAGWTPFNEWAFGAPLGAGGDPGAAYEGTAVAGVDLGDMEDGLYDPTRVSRLRSPVVDVSGHDRVRLQFWRWLSVEDREFDSARIEVNGAIAWQNATKGLSPEQNNLHHVDREWVFRDIDITTGIKDGKVELAFVLSADAGLDFGGWNLDSLCLVGTEAPPAPVCGDGDLDLGEQCDDGNTEPGDGCDPSCVIEGETTGGVGTTGGSGSTGDGTTGDGSATTGAMIDDDAGGCACTAGDSDRGGALFGLALLGLVGLGRRRRRS